MAFHATDIARRGFASSRTTRASPDGDAISKHTIRIHYFPGSVSIGRYSYYYWNRENRRSHTTLQGEDYSADYCGRCHLSHAVRSRIQGNRVRVYYFQDGRRCD